MPKKTKNVADLTLQVAGRTLRVWKKLGGIGMKLAAFSLPLILSGCTFFPIYLAPTPAPLEEKKISGSGKDKILLIDISGIISEEEKESGLTKMPGMVTEMKEALEKAAADRRVKAVVLRIDSPGGGVTASDIIYHEIRLFQKRTGKKVIAHIMGLGASGGYYIAVSADRIIAQPTSVTGSIGVIMLSVNIEGLLQKIGVEGTAIKSRDKKDIGSPLRKMTPEERKILQSIIDQMYERFLQVIVAGRKNLDADRVRKLSDGRVYNSQQALEAGLVDQLGYLEDSIALAEKEAGLTEAKVITYYRPGTYKDNIYSQAGGGGNQTLNLINFDLHSLVQDGKPKFMYLWMP